MVIQGEKRMAVEARWGLLASPDQRKALSTFNAWLETVRGSPGVPRERPDPPGPDPHRRLYEWTGEQYRAVTRCGTGDR